MTTAAAIVLVGTLLGRGDAGRAFGELGRWLDREPQRLREPEVRFYLDLFALARCEPLAEWVAPRPGLDAWTLARAHVAIERLRLGRVQPAWVQKLTWTAGAAPRGSVEWPGERESWSDEAPRVTIPPSLCGAPAPSYSEAAVARALEQILVVLDPRAPTRDALLLELAGTQWRQGRAEVALRTLRLIDEQRLAAPERHELRLLEAQASERVGKGSLELWVRAREGAPPDAYIDAHLVAAALKQADDGAIELARQVAETRAGPSAWFASRAAVAAFKQEDEAGFLRHARRLIAMRSRAELLADPMLREIGELAALELALHPFGEQVIEVAESLGPPRELHDRLDAAADAALRVGRPAFARDGYLWLTAHTKNTFLLPYYQARTAVALLALGDVRGFGKTYADLAKRALEAHLPPPPPTTTVKGRAAPAPATAGPGRALAARRRPLKRRGPLEWDRQLLFATRDALPLATAALPDAKALGTLVATLQEYVRTAPPEQTYAEVTELYRVASAQLPLSKGARPYAEKVGAERVPVVLGEVQVAAAASELPPPADLAPPALAGARSLLCLPDGPVCWRWAGPLEKKP